MPAHLRIFSFLLLAFLILSSFTVAQDEIPDKIRGYKVYRADVAVNKPDSDADFSVNFEFGEPELASVSLGGIKLRFPARVLVDRKGGRVDFITFENFKIDGIEVEIDEFRKQFKFEKGTVAPLPEPLEIYVPAGGVLRGAFRELRNSRSNWEVNGRVYIFGKFKKFGFGFKRVVPVDVDFEIPNQIREKLFSVQLHRDLRCDSGIIYKQGYVGVKRFSIAEFNKSRKQEGRRFLAFDSAL